MDEDSKDAGVNREEYVKMRARLRELTKQLRAERKDAVRYQNMASLFQEAHQLFSLKLPISKLGERFLRLLFGLLDCDRGGFLLYDRETGSFNIEFAQGFPETSDQPFTPLITPGEFQIIKPETESDSLVSSLRALAGIPSLLWAFNPQLSAALLLARSSDQDGSYRVFKSGDREIISNALKLMADIIKHSMERASFQKTQERLELVIRGADLGMWDWNVSTGEVFFDTRWKEMLGYSDDEIRPHYLSWEKLVNPEDLPRVLDILKEHLEGRTPFYEIEHRLRMRDGSFKWILARGMVVERDEEGRPLRMAGTHLDISARKHAEEDMSKFKLISDRANYGTAIVDLNGDILYINEHFADMHGYTPEELIGNNLKIFHTEEQMPRVHELNRQLREEGGYTSEEVWHVHKDGFQIPTLMSGMLVSDHKGRAYYMAATAIDITDRVRAEDVLTQTLGHLEKSHNDMLSILNELSLGTALFDREGRITFLSRAGEWLTGLKQSSVEGKIWSNAFPFSQRQMARLSEMIARTAEERERVAVSREDLEGRRFRMEIEVKDDPRKPENKILFIYDTSELYDLRQLLNERVKYQDLIGKSKLMQVVFEQIQQLCKVDTTVLIEGDTGTGKELVARALHFASLRKKKSFIAVNCSGLTESVLHSQLFGHKRGSFTGAVNDHRGVFEEADQGTVFLDEIAGISPSVQASLLRVLDKKEITPLGESKPRRVNVRIIAASNQDLRSEVDKGIFRADLFYRIRVARIHLPPLSQRREDIPLLAHSFLRQSKASSGKQVVDFSTQAMKWLREYDWPGNVRELKNAVEFAALQCRQSFIRSSDLPPEILDSSLISFNQVNGKGNDKEKLMAALKATGGNRTAAARKLGISRATFYRKLAELNIEL